MLIDELAHRLRSIYAGPIEDDFQPWLTDAILARVLAEAVVIQPPQCVLYSHGEPLRCHANALHPTLLEIRAIRSGAVLWVLCGGKSVGGSGGVTRGLWTGMYSLTRTHPQRRGFSGVCRGTRRCSMGCGRVSHCLLFS